MTIKTTDVEELATEQLSAPLLGYAILHGNAIKPTGRKINVFPELSKHHTLENPYENKA